MNIIFTCPVCGSHELLCIQQAVHRTPISIMRTDSGEWSSTPNGSIQELYGSTLGYRCAHCRYPDVPNHDTNSGLHWRTLDHVAAAGVLSSPVETSITPHTVTSTSTPMDGKNQ